MTAPADGPEGQAPAQDVKEKMREALERKKQGVTPHAAGAAHDSKVHSAHGPESHRKEFRRKSG